MTRNAPRRLALALAAAAAAAILASAAPVRAQGLHARGPAAAFPCTNAEARQAGIDSLYTVHQIR